MKDPMLESAGLTLDISPDGTVTEPILNAERIAREAPSLAISVSGDPELGPYPGERRSSPSKYKSIELSPAFEDDKSRPEHPMTARGKLMHAAVETGNDDGLEPEEVELVEKCRKALIMIRPKNAVIRKEVKFPILGSDYGFVDELILAGNSAIIVDHKFGQNRQEAAETNPQGIGYAIGILRSFPYLQDVRVFFLYPRLDIIDMATFRRSDLPRLIARIRLLKLRHDAATPESCVYSDDTCGYCRHLAGCPTAAKALLPIATRYAQTHQLPAPVDDLASLADPDRWAALLRAAPVLEATADSIRRHGVEFAKAGGVIPGFDLISVAGKRTITSPQLAHEIATSRFGISPESFLRAVKVSASDLLDLAKESAPRGKKGARAQELEDALRDAGALSMGTEHHQLRKSKS